jgi:molybdopterin-guanine dinucleotide biosynthesis protein A
VIVAVLAGGRGSRLGGSKACVELGGRPLISRVLAAAAGFETVVVAKRDTALPELDVPVWIEPDEPFHPLTGLVAALERGPVVAVACDQPWVTSALLSALARAPAVPWIDGAYEPLPAHYEPSQLPVLRAALAEEASLRRTLERLDPARFDLSPFGDPVRLVAGVNTPEELAAAERELARREGAAPLPARRAGPAPPATGAEPLA